VSSNGTIQWPDNPQEASKEEYEEKQKELEGIANSIMQKLFGVAGGSAGGDPSDFFWCRGRERTNVWRKLTKIIAFLTFLFAFCAQVGKIGRSTHIHYIVKLMSDFFNDKEPNKSINPVTRKVLATAQIGNMVTYLACPFYFFASALIKLLHFPILILLYVLILFASVPHHRVELKQWQIPRTKRTRPHPQSIAKLMTNARILERRRGRGSR
jgi:hypothetical protein